ncbi:MAG: hypothetical protein NTY59_12890 [Alphaproteobacteria bacterium]|nr:hypothetical protein [Alphaproteobacteria bacterium]
MIRVRAGLLAFLLCAAFAAPAAAQVTGSDALDRLNASFRARYAESRAATLGRTDPVILVEFETLVLLHKGERRAEPFTPPLYHQLKSIAHIPLALFVMSSQYSDKPLPAEARRALDEYRAQVVAARDALPAIEIPADLRPTLDTIISSSLSLIDETRASGRFDPMATTALARSLEPALMSAAREAARVQLNGLDRASRRFRADLGEEAWSRTYVVVLGVRQARVGNLQYSYFQRVLGPVADNKRLIYAESVFDETKALELLGTILLDREIGVAFFDQEYRMERDLLSDATAEYLPVLLPKP